jgi:hypothetical protein
MIVQYSILNSCLSKLKASNLPTLERLKLEVQLIQTKRLLLDHDVEHGVAGNEGSEAEFRALYCLVRSACEVCDSNGEINRVTAHLHAINDGLKANLSTVPKPNNKNTVGLFGKKLFNSWTL